MRAEREVEGDSRKMRVLTLAARQAMRRRVRFNNLAKLSSLLIIENRKSSRRLTLRRAVGPALSNRKTLRHVI